MRGVQDVSVVSIPEGPIKSVRAEWPKHSRARFQFPKDQLKEARAILLMYLMFRFNSRRTN